ncbi:hypothetical protein GWI33_019520 [Rhynchophorus ferrugineus]|uniref:Uncharacterized protein n=1 Tax=Rhynchophorus ferrugineus TaxID=354439 RepID=A0A834M1B2_RHYFE|nr:hypothetical protein GWI33_019520 [Rhynchophorus ferrugineus]
MSPLAGSMYLCEVVSRRSLEKIPVGRPARLHVVYGDGDGDSDVNHCGGKKRSVWQEAGRELAGIETLMVAGHYASSLLVARTTGTGVVCEDGPLGAVDGRSVRPPSLCTPDTHISY